MAATPRAPLIRLIFWIAVAAILGLAAILRFTNSRNNDPPDDSIIIDVVGHLRHGGDWDDNWATAHLRDQTQSYNQYNFSSYMYSTFFFYSAVKRVPGTLAWRSDNDGITLYHFWSSLLATLAVGTAMILGFWTSGRLAALGAGLLTAASVLLVQDAHYLRPESFTTLVTALAVALAWPTARPKYPRIIAAGFLVGLLIACKVSMLLLVWIPAIPVLAVWRSLATPARIIWSGTVAGAVIVGFIAGVPYALVHPNDFLYGVGRLMTQYAGSHLPHSHYPVRMVPDMIFLYAGKTMGWPLLACATVGTILLAWRRQWAVLALVAGPPFVFGAYFATRTVFFERNLSHVAPLLFVLSALGCVEIATWVGRRTKLPPLPLFAVLAVTVALPSLLYSRALVFYDFAGQASADFQQFRDSMRARNPAAEFESVTLLDDGPLSDLTSHFRYSTTPELVEVCDFGDDATKGNLRRLREEFTLTSAGEYHGSFDRTPVSTLRAYCTTHTLYYLVTGPKPGPGG